MDPLLLLFISIVFVVVAIAVFRVHAFIVLTLAAFIVGMLAPPAGIESHADAVELALREFGSAVGRIGFVIALAAVIGMFLMESGAADKIVRRLLAVFGEKRAGLALMLGGFILSIPVFFDTVFFLMIPLARVLALRTGKNYLFYVLACACGATLTHSLVPPTPGPLLVTEMLELDIGVAMLAGICAALPVALFGLAFAAWLGKRYPVQLREAAGASLDELRKQSSRDESELPGLIGSILPVLLPVALITTNTVVGSFFQESVPLAAQSVLDFFGNKNVALLTGAVAAAILWTIRQPKGQRAAGRKLQAPLETAGLIILITGAGGSFGAMIGHAGVGPALQSVAERWNVGPIVLAWGLTWIIRAALGSATVAMLTGGGLMAAMLAGGVELPYHPVYIFLAVGFGSKSISWMNDSGFWVVGRMSGMTETETLRSWTLLLAVMSVVGLFVTLLLSKILPFA